MVDYVKLKLKAGDGGSGTVSFQNELSRRKGPPDGGDGGDGGNVYLKASKDLTTLLPYRYKKNFKAEKGKRGGRSHMKGHSGQDFFLQIPAGTRVSDQEGRFMADLTKNGEKVLVAKGGKGGRGNSHVKRSDFIIKDKDVDFQTKKKKKEEIWKWFEVGEEGQETQVTLELKLLADVGLVGLPNAGKSTLLSKLTAATPKIASYPFTTLEPVLGVMSHKGKEVVLADIPGLIEGASKGKGLGDLFLRHVERTKILAHLVSVESDSIQRDNEKIIGDKMSFEKKCRDHPESKPKKIDGPPNSGFLINNVFFHPGDGIELENFEVKNLSVPIAGPTIDYDQAWKFATKVRATKVIPMHYSNPTFPADTQEFAKNNPGSAQVEIMDDGSSIEIG